jgi:hypothetical protein
MTTPPPPHLPRVLKCSKLRVGLSAVMQRAVQHNTHTHSVLFCFVLFSSCLQGSHNNFKSIWMHYSCFCLFLIPDSCGGGGGGPPQEMRNFWLYEFPLSTRLSIFSARSPYASFIRPHPHSSSSSFLGPSLAVNPKTCPTLDRHLIVRGLERHAHCLLVWLTCWSVTGSNQPRAIDSIVLLIRRCCIVCGWNTTKQLTSQGPLKKKLLKGWMNEWKVRILFRHRRGDRPLARLH